MYKISSIKTIEKIRFIIVKTKTLFLNFKNRVHIKISEATTHKYI